LITAASGHDTIPEIDLDDIAAWMEALPEAFNHAGAEFILHPSVYARFVAASGGTYQGVDDQNRPLLLGRPVNLSTKAPRTSAASTIVGFYGSFSEAAALGDRGLRFASSNKLPDGFLSGKVALKATSRVALSVHEPGDSTNAGAYVALQTAAS
jgi:HK97 family phage major capsid protein